ncbi:MAG: hypothetical protein ACXWZ4_12875, partial [Gemmatirosa sp.]
MPISIVGRAPRAGEERRWIARLANAVPGAILTLAMMGLAVASARAPRGWPAARAGRNPVSRERVTFVVPPSRVAVAVPVAIAPAVALPRATGARTRSTPGSAPASPAIA